MSGLDEPLTPLLVWLPQFVLATAVVAGFASLVVWGLSRLSGGEHQRGVEALNAVLTATVLRRDRGETLGRLLETAVQHLGAVSGAVLLGRAGGLELVSAVGVQRLDLLVRLPATEALAARAQVAPLVLETVGLYTPWAALSDGLPFSLCALALHGEAAPGLLVLCWPRRLQAEVAAPVLRQIGWYADQVLAEYAGLEKRARDVQVLNDQLLQQDRLVRTAAHDMANKVAAPLAFLEDLSGIVEGDQAETLTQATQELGLLLQMLGELGNPNRPLEPTLVAVEDVVSVAAAMMRVHGRPFTVDAPSGLPPYLWGERGSILRIVDNLLRNAVRYNREMPALQVWLRVRPAEGDMVLFEIGDSGRGIAPEMLPRLFEFGFRADSSAQVSGHGLGLWSCRRLVQNHGGHIGVESVPGKGARFYFTLPAATDQRMEQLAYEPYS